MTIDDRIKSRIRKLLNLAADESAADGEIENAMRFAKDLMDAHHLTEEDVAEGKDKDSLEGATCDDSFVFTHSQRISNWESALANFICDFIGGVKFYRTKESAVKRNELGIVDSNDPRRAKRFIFYGISEDTALAAELWREIAETITAAGRLKYGGSVHNGEARSYAEGFVSGLREANRKADAKALELAQSRANAFGEKNALVVIEKRGDLIKRKQQMAEEWILNVKGIKLTRIARSRGGRHHHHAYGEGKSDGQKQDVSANRTRKLT